MRPWLSSWAFGLTLSVAGSRGSGPSDWPCDSEVFCSPDKEGLLHTIQTAAILKDSKTFVDMPMKFAEETVLEHFMNLPDHEKSTLEDFLAKNFDREGTELETVDPEDWTERPEFIDTIEDEKFRQLALKMNKIWKHLTRRISKQEAEIEAKSSLIFLERPFVVPGGRFREVYYWDSYWTIKGLLLCNMFHTSRGMIENFKHLVEKIGHIPNGNRVYYNRRSQPPLFPHMVQDYLTAKDDKEHERELLAEVIWALDEEYLWWEKRMTEVEVGGTKHKLARYKVDVGGPRPESYVEDYSLASKLPEEERRDWYVHMKSGAESGWDYSSRWFVGNTSWHEEEELLKVRTADILPVDLNSFLCKNAKILADFFSRMERPSKAEEYAKKHSELREAIHAVLHFDNLWHDYNIVTRQHTGGFYPSNLAPLYSDCIPPSLDLNSVADKILEFNETLSQPGGPPSSTVESRQQWDFPNVWPPLVEMTVVSLEKTNTSVGRSLAKQIANNFLNNVLRSEESSGNIYEKYNCTGAGRPGGGGEYDVQEGFGWTNGVALSLLARYPDLKSSSSSLVSSTLILLLVLLHIYSPGTH